ncbi:MAG: hypothetical protein WC713_11630 [Candidatus Methylomirabilota bacterium]
MPESSNYIGQEDNSLLELPIDKEIIFSDHKGNYSKKVEKRETKLLKKVVFIKPFLKKDEKIILVTNGCSPISVMEQLVTGAVLLVYLKRCFFIFTNKRIFHIPTTKDFVYRNSIAVISYGDCQNIAIKNWQMEIKYKNGKKERFIYIPGKDRKKIRALVQKGTLIAEQTKTMGRGHICPRCATDLVQNEYVCPNCQLEFKNLAKAKKTSILYPGGGYFYTGHLYLGIVDAFVETFLTIVVILTFIAGLMGEEGAIGAFVFYTVIFIIEKLVSVYHSTHFVEEYIPLEKEITPINATQQ